MKIKVTAQQRKNALEARDVMVPSIPDKNIATDLGYWGHGARAFIQREHRVECGTAACFGGWCTLWPSFIEQGVCADLGSWSPILKTADDTVYDTDTVAEHLFGDRAMFDARYFTEKGTEKEIILKRLDKLIKNSKVVS